LEEKFQKSRDLMVKKAKEKKEGGSEEVAEMYK